MRRYRHSIVLCCILLLTACNSDKLDVHTPPMPQNVPDETSYDILITEYIGDRIDYTLDAKKIERFFDRRLTHSYSVILQTFDELERLNSTVKADTITVDEARNVIYAIGNVYMSSVNGSIRAPLIIWDRNVDEIIAPANVTLTRGENVMRGNNLRTDVKISFAEMNTVSAEGKVYGQEFDW